MPEVWRMTAIADMVYVQSCLEVLRVTAAMLQFFRLKNISAFHTIYIRTQFAMKMFIGF